MAVPTFQQLSRSVSESAGAALKWNRAPDDERDSGPDGGSRLIFTVNVAWERNNGIDVKWRISKLNAKNV